MARAMAHPVASYGPPQILYFTNNEEKTHLCTQGKSF